ncbi:hypothetical protein BKA70DRAFT_1261265 [Coprinopsis sp. MPI-PUGE-AT-0042]|nr:hypothetical protein BKA70DRAFT_1261265 [Coprinopsis sp. MPI-PUGE-AT-0042]
MRYNDQMEPTERYSRELAAYTLRQFSTANSQLDERKKSKIAKLPGSYSRVLHAERMTRSLGVGSQDSNSRRN